MQNSDSIDVISDGIDRFQLSTEELSTATTYRKQTDRKTRKFKISAKEQKGSPLD